MKLIRLAAGWSAATLVLILRWTCRVHRHRDPRPELRARSQTYIYSVLHAHQVSTLVQGEPGTGAMVSQSADGEILVPALRVCGIVPVRGSSDSKGRDKGGRAAFKALVEHVEGGAPAYLAVDGPRGPRNRIQKGVALLSMKAGVAVINVCAVSRRRWILARAWDRLQIPKPFSRIDVYFGEPLVHRSTESAEEFRQRIEAELNALEREHDPDEAERAQPAPADEPLARAA